MTSHPHFLFPRLKNPNFPRNDNRYPRYSLQQRHHLHQVRDRIQSSQSILLDGPQTSMDIKWWLRCRHIDIVMFRRLHRGRLDKWMRLSAWYGLDTQAIRNPPTGNADVQPGLSRLAPPLPLSKVTQHNPSRLALQLHLYKAKQHVQSRAGLLDQISPKGIKNALFLRNDLQRT